MDVTLPTRAPLPKRRPEADLLERLAERAQDLFYHYRLVPEPGFVYVSPVATRLTGYTPEDHYADPLLGRKLIHPDDQEILDRVIERGAYEEPIVLRWIHRDGHVLWTETKLTPVYDEGMLVGIDGVARDVTERKAAEARQDRLNRALRTFSAVTHAVVHAESEQALLDDVCRAIVEEAGYSMAWVGRLAQDERRSVRPVAWAGRAAGYLDEIDVVATDEPHGRGPAGLAVRRREAVAFNDLARDDGFQPWRVQAHRQGFGACIALPLANVDGALFGTLNIYADEAGAFDAEAVELLDTMASDLAHGLRALRAQVRQRESEARYRTLFESAQDGVFVLSDVIEEANTTLCEMLGRPLEDLLGQQPHLLSPPEQPDGQRSSEAGKAYIEAARSGVPQRFSWVHERADGQLIDTEIALKPVLLDGAPRILCTMRDVTAQRAAEGRLHLLSAALEAAANAILITEADGTVAWVNPAFTELTGYSVGEVLGQRPSLLSSGRQDAAYYANLWKTILDGQVWHGEIINRRKDGVYYTEEMSITPVRADSGEVTHFIAIKQDVTERKARHRELKRRKEQFEKIIAHLPVLVSFFDEDGRFQFVNRAWEQTLGWSFEETCAHPNLLATFYPDVDLREEVQEHMLRADGSWRDFRLRTRDGRELDFAWANVMLSDGTRIGIGQDVTARKRYEQGLVAARREAEEVARVKTSLLNNMSHEIRTPLTTIIGFSEVLLAEADPEMRELVEMIHQGGHRLLDTLNSVLDLAHLEGGEVLHPTRLELGEEVRAAVTLYLQRAESHGLSLEVDLPSGAVPARLDRRALHRILGNLVSNAIKFTPEGGIVVRLRPGPRSVRLEVQDTGIGIGEEFLPHLFEEFRQESTGLGREHEGTGLGLTIVQRLTQLMGGTVQVMSEQGTGSIFTVELPRVSSAGGD